MILSHCLLKNHSAIDALFPINLGGYFYEYKWYKVSSSAFPRASHQKNMSTGKIAVSPRQRFLLLYVYPWVIWLLNRWTQYLSQWEVWLTSNSWSRWHCTPQSYSWWYVFFVWDSCPSPTYFSLKKSQEGPSNTVGENISLIMLQFMTFIIRLSEVNKSLIEAATYLLECLTKCSVE